MMRCVHKGIINTISFAGQLNFHKGENTETERALCAPLFPRRINKKISTKALLPGTLTGNQVKWWSSFTSALVGSEIGARDIEDGMWRLVRV